MLKKTLNMHDGLDITKFEISFRLILRGWKPKVKPKKSEILKWKEIQTFLADASDYQDLASKVSYF